MRELGLNLSRASHCDQWDVLSCFLAAKLLQLWRIAICFWKSLISFLNSLPHPNSRRMTSHQRKKWSYKPSGLWLHKRERCGLSPCAYKKNTHASPRKCGKRSKMKMVSFKTACCSNSLWRQLKQNVCLFCSWCCPSRSHRCENLLSKHYKTFLSILGFRIIFIREICGAVLSWTRTYCLCRCVFVLWPHSVRKFILDLIWETLSLLWHSHRFGVWKVL